MFSLKKTMKSTEDYLDNIRRLKEEIETTDAVIIGAGAGLSTSAGFTYTGQRFEDNFSDFIKKYGFRDMYSGGFYPFESLEEYWAYWSRYVFINRYMDNDNGTYKRLFELVKDKDYFVLTTNVDHQFQKAGFDKQRLFYTQGDYGLFQCSEPCHNATYDNEKVIRDMVTRQEDMKVPTELIPHCPVCGKPMIMNLRCDNRFVQDGGWYKANERYRDFINRHRNMHILFLEFGVGFNTPIIIKYPFWQMTSNNPRAVYCCVNYGEAFCPKQIIPQAICINDDVNKILKDLYNSKRYVVFSFKGL